MNDPLRKSLHFNDEKEKNEALIATVNTERRVIRNQIIIDKK